MIGISASDCLIIQAEHQTFKHQTLAMESIPEENSGYEGDNEGDDDADDEDDEVDDEADEEEEFQDRSMKRKNVCGS